MKTWFAKKINGEVIPLTEREALTHFEDNNIARRMRLQFLGTSSGEHYKESKNKIKKFIQEKTTEECPDFYKMSVEERNMAQSDIRHKYLDEIKKIQEEAYNAEYEEAIANGVERPDPTLRIITTDGGGRQVSGTERNKIISQLPH